MTRQRFALISAVTAAAFWPGAAYGHGFGESYDLPLPLNLLLVGAAATVALSFVVIGIFVKPRPREVGYPRYDLLKWRVVAAVASTVFVRVPLKLLSVLLLTLVVATSFFGTDDPLKNFSPTFVWIIWWVGMGYVVALIGNVWPVVNPWSALFAWGEKLLAGGQWRGMWAYPTDWNVWPAVALFFAFAWIENVYTGAARLPDLGVLVVAYSLVTWLGMLAFGRHTWLRRGEAFSVLFSFFTRFAPTEVRVVNRKVCRDCGAQCRLEDGECVDCYECFEFAAPDEQELNLRPYAVGLARSGKASVATAIFVVLALATVTFDGLQETPAWLKVQNAVYEPATVFGTYTVEAIGTLGIMVFPTLFLAAYVAFSWAVKQLSGEPWSAFDVARVFVFSLVPIALAYNLAHFISFLAIQGQLIFPLASDPFGSGADLFGTAHFRPNITIINAKFVWYVSVASIITGHIVSVYVAHVISLRTVSDHRLALRSQYSILALMVLYTASSLWILAQPILS